MSSQPQSDNLTWTPRGRWDYRDAAPIILGADPDGCCLLSLRCQSSRPIRAELAGQADEESARARAAVLSAFQSEDCWIRYLEAKSEHAAARSRLDSLDKEARELEVERLKLSAKPRGHGARLAEIQARHAEIGQEKHAAELDLQALSPILKDARKDAEARAEGIARDAAARAYQERMQALDDSLANFVRKHGDELTTLACLLHSRNESFDG